jgi:hypothetical protein
VVMWAKPAGKPANTNFRVFYFHGYPFYRFFTVISILMDLVAADKKELLS